MRRLIRYVLLAVGAAQIVLTVALIVQWQPLVDLWPFEGTTPLTFIFVASIVIAAAASTLWAAASENYGALAGIGLDYLVIFSAMTVILATLNPLDDVRRVAYTVIAALVAIFGLGLFLWSRRNPIEPMPPMPAPVRWSFVVFVVGLLIVGGLVVLGIQDVIPWSVTPELALVVGWMFIGAAAYFAYGLLRPSWLNSAGQLLGFLAYDLVLIVPFVLRLPNGPANLLPSLILYTAVVIYSGLLAAFYLFVNGPTRRRTWSRAKRRE